MLRPTGNHPNNGNGSHTSENGVSNGANVDTEKHKKRRRRVAGKSSGGAVVGGIEIDVVLRVAITAAVLFALVTITLHRTLESKSSTSTRSGVEWIEDRLSGVRGRLHRDTVIETDGPFAGFDPNAPLPDEMAEFGDKSAQYRKLRFEYDKKYPVDTMGERFASVAERTRKRSYAPISPIESVGYDVFNCPDDPPPHYPVAFNAMELLKHWPTDDSTPRETIYQGICVFDHARDHDKAARYREKELPFVVRDDPDVMRTVERWNDPDYLPKLLGDVKHRAEYSTNNHFMYWNMPRRRDKHGRKKKKRIPEGWTAPTENIRMTYAEWTAKATVKDDASLGPDRPHWYFRLIGCGYMGKNCDSGNSEMLFDELPFFQPRPEPTLYMVEPKEQKGIHCRFGMKGVIAENHFDGSRNVIVVLGGERRYLLAHPNQCESLCLYPQGHPSARHSAVDWSDPDLETYPKFANAQINEIVLQAGDALYLPTDWFHYIVSLETNFQCNTRSGVTKHYKKDLATCGF